MLSGEKSTMVVRRSQRRDKAVLLGLLVVMFALAAVFVYDLWMTHVFCSEIKQLDRQAHSLQIKTDSLNSAYRALGNSTEGRLNFLEDAFHNLQKPQSVQNETIIDLDTSSASSKEGEDMVDDRYVVLQQAVEGLKQEQSVLSAQLLSKVDSSDTKTIMDTLDTLTKGMQQTQSLVDGLKSSFDNMDNGLNSLGRQFSEHTSQRHSSTVNLGDICSVQRVQCSVPSSRQGGYWKSCRTPSTTLDQAGKVTLSQGCSFHPQSKFSEYQESLTLQEGGGSVWCDCDVTFPGEDGDKQRSIAGDFKGDCYLTIFRCNSQS